MIKFENYFITITMGIIMIITSLRGAWEILYYDMDLMSDQSSVITLIFAIICIYWVVKSIIIRLRKR